MLKKSGQSTFESSMFLSLELVKTSDRNERDASDGINAGHE